MNSTHKRQNKTKAITRANTERINLTKRVYKQVRIGRESNMIYIATQ